MGIGGYGGPGQGVPQHLLAQNQAQNQKALSQQQYQNQVLGQFQGGQLAQLGQTLTQNRPPSSLPTGPILLHLHHYCVRKIGSCYHVQNLKHRYEVCTWKFVPSRRILAAAIRMDRGFRPRFNARDEFGSLLGVRWFRLGDDLRLVSPNQGTVWDTNVLTVSEWCESDAVRGVAGIHAAWPTMGGTVQPEIDTVEPTNTLALVRGLGKFVSGATGWRAEKVIIDTVYLAPELINRWRVVKRLARLYPEISFEEQPWTLEKSKKSEKQNPARSHSQDRELPPFSL